MKSSRWSTDADQCRQRSVEFGENAIRFHTSGGVDEPFDVLKVLDNPKDGAEFLLLMRLRDVLSVSTADIGAGLPEDRRFSVFLRLEQDRLTPMAVATDLRTMTLSPGDPLYKRFKLVRCS